jgi:hypothetical protein
LLRDTASKDDLIDPADLDALASTLWDPWSRRFVAVRFVAS